MKPPKIKWEVSPAPTGPYRSFARRGWPIGLLPNGQRVFIQCSDDYVPAKVKAGDHAELVIRLDLFIDGEMTLRTLKSHAENLAEAKQIAANFFARNPQYIKDQSQ
ncbi:MAG: hypothetical protein U5N55_05035 [Cypionkella sp.]|nr:hypothetical protein [Cypionkella sp.]